MLIDTTHRQAAVGVTPKQLLEAPHQKTSVLHPKNQSLTESYCKCKPMDDLMAWVPRRALHLTRQTTCSIFHFC